MEIWRDVEGFEGLYQVSNKGRVKSLARYHVRGDRIMNFSKDKDGYLRVSLRKNDICKTKRLHILVAEAFIPNPNGHDIVHHKDHNKHNNYTYNLEWISKEKHDRLHQLEQGERVDKIDKVTGEVLASYSSKSEAARAVGGCANNIIRCCNGGFFDNTRNKWHYIRTAYEYVWKNLK